MDKTFYTASNTTAVETRRGQNLLDLRDVNLTVLLTAIWENAPISRVTLAQMTGLAPSSITRLIRLLRQKSLITETGKGLSSGGRQPIMIAPNPDAGVIVSLDLSGSTMRGGIFDTANNVICEMEQPFEGLGPEPINHQLIALTHLLLQDARVKERKLWGIGVSSPAVLGGFVYHSHTLKLSNFPLQNNLEEAFGVPVILQNDSHVAALAEKYYGAGRGLDDFIYLLISDGIGSGVILNGELYPGGTQPAGEIGHVVVEKDGALCSCGRRGCLETVATHQSILTHAQRILDYQRDEVLMGLVNDDSQRITLSLLREAAERGSTGAREIILYAADHVAFALVNAATLLGTAPVVVGGDVPQQLGNYFLENVSHTVNNYNRGFQKIELIPAKLDWRGLLQGISMLTLQRIIGINL